MTAVTAPVINPALEAEWTPLTKPTDRFKQLITPTLKTNQKGWDRFISPSGRGFCLVRLAEYTINVPFRLFATIGKMALAVIDIFKHIFTLPFDFDKHSGEIVMNFWKFIDLSTSFLLMPLSVAMDTAKLALGTLIHPMIGIKTTAFTVNRRLLNNSTVKAEVYYSKDGKDSYVDAKDNIVYGKGLQTAVINDPTLNLNNINCIIDKDGKPLFRA